MHPFNIPGRNPEFLRRKVHVGISAILEIELTELPAMECIMLLQRFNQI